MNGNAMNANQLPEWQARYRQRQRARIQFQARLAYLPKPMPSTSAPFTSNVSSVDPSATPRDWNGEAGDWSCN